MKGTPSIGPAGAPVAHRIWESLASYSVCDPHDAAAMRERIELAFRVLADPNSRARYDDGLGEDGAPPKDEVEYGLDPANDEPPPVPEVEPEIAGFDDLDEADDAPFDGARLRRARLRHGLDLERISAVTKVSPSYLHFLEEEQFDDLPATVYIRGFLAAYARCVGLDPERVVPPYMARVHESRVPSERGRRERR